MAQYIPIEVKRKCCELSEQGYSSRDIYYDYFVKEIENPQRLTSFYCTLGRWKKKQFGDRTTLELGTYEGFTAHGATVQISADGTITQAWIKQSADAFDTEAFLEAIRDAVEPYEPRIINRENSFDMLEIPLFDMHWGISYMDDYYTALDEILYLIKSHSWKEIIIPFGQDFFHNDSIANGVTTRGTVVQKVDMQRAVREAKSFMFSIIDTAIESADAVKVIYTPGNHDMSISWMFIQVLLERYGEEIVDDSIAYRKVITYGINSVMLTHGDAKKVSAKKLAAIFPVSFPKEFAQAKVREIHAGHLHHESEADIVGVMVRRLSTGGKTDDWCDREDFVGAHKRFMLFEWGLDKLKAIHYI